MLKDGIFSKSNLKRGLNTISGMQNPAQERSDTLRILDGACRLLEEGMAGPLVPDSGSNIAYALRGARSVTDVAAVTGGLHARKGVVRRSGEVAFGAEEWIAGTLLTVMKFDPAVRSAVRIQYSEKVYRILSDIFMECTTIRGKDNPAAAGLMDFTIAACCNDEVPDVIAVIGPAPESRVIWLFGEEPALLASNIIILSNRIE